MSEFTFEYDFEEQLFENVLKDGLKRVNHLSDIEAYIEDDSMNEKAHNFLKEQGVLGVLEQTGSKQVTNLLLGVILQRSAAQNLIAFPVLEHLLGTFVLKGNHSLDDIDQYEMGEKIVGIGWKNNLNIEEADQGIKITGHISAIPFADNLDLILVPFQNSSHKMLAIHKAAIQEHLEEMKSQDKSYTLYKTSELKVQFGVNQAFIFEYNDELFEKTKNILISAELQGISDFVLNMTVDYVKERKQFGVAIGKFQAVKHMLADMYVRAQSAKVSVEYASWSVENDGEDYEIVSNISKACTSNSALKNVEDAIHLHGGVGFTWEHSLHLYLKRTERLMSISNTRYSELEKIGDYFLKKLNVKEKEHV